MKFFRRHRTLWQAVIIISSLALVLSSILPAIFGR